MSVLQPVRVSNGSRVVPDSHHKIMAVTGSKITCPKFFDPYARTQDSVISQLKRVFSNWVPMFGESKSDLSRFFTLDDSLSLYDSLSLIFLVQNMKCKSIVCTYKFH